ncbi:hypothetical protein N7493_000911 [Penicillium malachiteum]|uniref:Uncharacterized protein n=1 Tax=Penicillium malachiteum TaxID=1324776 RepID=A0AAD6N1B9_9EURO|nr:hypothetical protein N7493_000911 [Penicillium malachiteum]
MTERLVANICRRKDAVYMLNLLVNKGYDLTITDSVMESTAWNEFRDEGIAAIQYLEKLHPEPLPFTDSAFVAAIKNSEQGKEILPYLLQHLPVSLLTDRVFEEACRNAGALKLLLDRQQNNLPIGCMLRKLPWSRTSGDVLQVLLERNLVNVDESTVKTLAPNFYALDALLSWKPDAPITEKVLIAGTNDARSMRLLLEVQGSTVHITEAVLDAALQSSRDLSVLQVIQHRVESFKVTEKMFKAALKKQTKYSGSLLIDYLVEQSSESLLRDFLLGDTWQDEDLWSDIPRCSFLIGFSRKTVLRIDGSLSEGLAFDIKNDTAYLVSSLYGEHCLPSRALL